MTMSRVSVLALSLTAVLIAISGLARATDLLTNSIGPRPVFPSFHRRCPQECFCDATLEQKKRVLCDQGGFNKIPTDAMDHETQIIKFTGSEERPNEVALGRIFMEFPALEEITITNSGLPAIGDSSFWPGRELKYLDLSSNKIRFIRDMDFNGLANLRSLNLSDNLLIEPPSAPFRFLSNLTWLSLAKNKMHQIVPRLFYKLGKLEYLDLSDNPLNDAKLTSDTFRDIQTLRSLTIERSGIRSISVEAYQQLPNLRELLLSDNALTLITSFEFTSLVNLKSLVLDGNQLTTIRDNAFYGLRLAHLGLARNQLAALPECAFCNLHLESLDISSNRFLAFQIELLRPIAFTLVSLNVAGNMLLDRPSNSAKRLISPLRKIQLLRLSNMNIQEPLDPDTFQNASKLMAIDLSSNRLSNISDLILNRMDNLETLDLSFNNFRSLSREFLQKLDNIPSLKAIYLHGNPWSCHQCHALPLLDWIQRSPEPYFNVCKRNGRHAGTLCMKCATPEHLASKDLHIMTEVELEYCIDPRVQQRLTASEPRVGFMLAILIIVTLVLIIVVVSISYKYRQHAVYYTHEEDRYEHAAQQIEKMPHKKTTGCFSISRSDRPITDQLTNGKHPFIQRKLSSSSCGSGAPLNNGSASPPSPNSSRPKVRF